MRTLQERSIAFMVPLVRLLLALPLPLRMLCSELQGKVRQLFAPGGFGLGGKAQQGEGSGEVALDAGAGLMLRVLFEELLRPAIM